MVWRSFFILSLLVICHSACADTCDNYKTAAQVLAGLSSDDPVAKLAAKTCGLQGSDPYVRGTVLDQLLQGITTMAFDLEPQPKDAIGAQTITQMPQLTVNGIIWDKDGRSFVGRLLMAGGPAVAGQLLGERMGIDFTGVPVLPKDGDTQDPAVTSCSAKMTISSDGTELTGLLRCTGIQPLFLISLGLD